MTEDEIAFMLLGFAGGVITTLSCMLICFAREMNEVDEERQPLRMGR